MRWSIRRGAASRRDAASGTLMGFIVTVGVFAITFGIVTLLLANAFIGSAHQAASADLDSVATNALRNLASTSGTPPNWAADPLGTTPPTQLGLLKSGSESTLDMTKVRSLETTLNSQSWYSTTSRGLLGIGAYQYHMRTYPEYPLTSTGDVASLASTRLAYVGHYATANDPFYVEDANSTRESAALPGLGMTYTNALAASPGDPVPTFAAANKFADTSYHLERYLALGLAGFAGDADAKEGTANDSYWKVVNLDDYPSEYFPSDASAHGVPHHVLTTSNRNSREDDGWSYAQGVVGAAPDRLIVAKLDLTSWQTAAINLQLNHRVSGHNGLGSTQFASVDVTTCPTSCNPWTTLQQWTNTASSPWWEQDNVSLTPYAGQVVYVSLAWHTSVAQDQNAMGWFLRSLYVNATAAGHPTALYANTLDYTTTNYDAVLLGSSTTSANLNDFASGYAFKEALKDWVVQGGSFLAFGGPNVNTSFLAPFFTTAAAPVATGPLLAGASDFTHPVLTTPHTLSFQDYPNAGKTWGGGLPQFTQVILGTSGGQTVPVLAVSQQNNLWKGTIVLTEWQPGRIADVTERHDFFDNAIAFARYHPLYLEFGGSIPPHVPIGSAEKGTIVDATSFHLGAVETKFILYVWQ